MLQEGVSPNWGRGRGANHEFELWIYSESQADVRTTGQSYFFFFSFYDPPRNFNPKAELESFFSGICRIYPLTERNSI